MRHYLWNTGLLDRVCAATAFLSFHPLPFYPSLSNLPRTLHDRAVGCLRGLVLVFRHFP